MSPGMRARHSAVFTLSISAIALGMALPAAAQQAPAAAELPAVEVIGKKSAPAKKKQAAKKAPAPKASPVQAATPAPAPEPAASDAPGSPGTATGPVENYAATRSATGTKTDTPLKQTPQSISVAGKEQLRDQGVQNLNEALRYMPGVLADGFGYDNRGDYSVVRGIPAAYFIDGLRTSYGNYTNAIPIEPYTLERVELLRGPASMLYGQTTTGGIINGVSKLPSAIPYGEITAEYGSFDFKQVKADFTGPLTADGRWLYRITGLARDADTQVDFVENDRLMIQPSLTFRPTKDTSITLLGNLRKDEGGIVQQFLPQVGTLTPNINNRRIPRDNFQGEKSDFYDTNAQSATLMVDHRFNPDLKLHHASRYAHFDNEYVSHLPAILTPFRALQLGATSASGGFLNADQTEVLRLLVGQKNRANVFNSDTNITGVFDTGGLSHKVTGGYDFMRYSTDNQAYPGLVTNATQANDLYDFLGAGRPFTPFDVYNPTYGQSPVYLDFAAFAGGDVFGALVTDPQFQDRPHEAQIQNGIYIQDQIRLGNWIAVLGLRQDWLRIEQAGSPTITDTATTGRAGLMYEFNFGLTPYVSYSESFTPQPGSQVVITNDIPNLFGGLGAPQRAATPLEGEQIEVGFKFQPVGANWIVNAAYYELQEKNQIKSPDTIANSLQGAEVETRGFEVEAIGQVTQGLKVLASYTYTDSEYTKYPEPLGLKTGTAVEGIPRHMASLWGIYTFDSGFLRGFSLGAGVRYIGETTDVSPDLLSVALGSPVMESVTTPSYALFDAMVAYETEDWRWSLTAQNLEDEYYVVSCSVLRQDCGIGQARTIITGLTYKF
jgi:iron complex outermembrane receptor protein